MKTTEKQKGARTCATAGSHALAKYRTFSLPTIEKQIQSMHAFLVHRLAFTLMGDDDLARAAGRAWVEDALILATMEAATAAEAQRKVEHISEQLDQWARGAAAGHHHLAAVRALDAVIAEERSRWGLEGPISGGAPNLH